MPQISLPTEVDVCRAQHDPAFRQTLLLAQLSQLKTELDKARVTTTAGVMQLERMREQAKLAIELAGVIGRIQHHLRTQEDACERAA